MAAKKKKSQLIEALETIENLPKPEPITVPEPRRFTVIRKFDENGISGVGRVLDGVVWHNGKVSVCWRTDTPDSKSLHGHSSMSTFDSFKGFKLIHIDSHPDNKTEIKWFDETLNSENNEKLN